jgi:hypothetical protein
MGESEACLSIYRSTSTGKGAPHFWASQYTGLAHPSLPVPLPQIGFSLLSPPLPYSLARSPHIVSNAPPAVGTPIGQCFFPQFCSRIDGRASVAAP